LNNNRGNIRRRGRGNNNRPQGGGQQLNRIDSRARGNAPQLLEKYKKLAHDAHLNGDRVTEEYNLQFAEHYFRVMADTRLRQEEQRTRRDDRWQEGGEGYREEADDAGEFSVEGEYSPYEQPYGNSNNSGGNGNSGGNTGNRREREERPRREERAERPERPERAQRAERPEQEAPSEEAGDEQQEQRSPYEPPENPFVRENRPARGLRARREDRRPRGEDNAEAPASAPADEAAPEEGEAAPSFDPNLLPPSISTAREEVPAEEVAEAKPRRRTRRKPSADDAGEALESVS
jgi:hypothetical protein